MQHNPLVAIFKKRRSNTITDTTMNLTRNAPIQSQDNVHTWTRSIHGRLAFQTKPQGKQRCRNTQYAAKAVAIQTTTNIPDCMTTQELLQAMLQAEHLQWLQEYIIRGWLENRDQISQDMRTYLTFLDDMAVIEGVILKGRYMVI